MATPAVLRVASALLLLAGVAAADEGLPGAPPAAPPSPAPPAGSPDDDLERAARELRPPPAIPPTGSGGRRGADDRGGAGPLPPTTFVHLTVDRRFGRWKTFAVDESTMALVMVGNPRIRGESLDVKARTIVAWFDRGKVDLGVFSGQGQGAPGGTSGALAPRPAPGAVPAAPAKGPAGPGADVIPEALLGVYAEGGVELVTEGMSFRALELYLDPRARHALLVEPRFDTTLPLRGGDVRVPVHVRAERARILAQGFAAFDRADVSTSTANDRIHLQVRTLTVEEYGTVAMEEPVFLGFRGFGSLHYVAKDVEARGERLPLGYWPEAGFGGEEGLEEFPARIRRLTVARRSSFGWYGVAGVGGKAGPAGDRWLDWEVDGAYYTKRGPALGTAFEWDREKERLRGRLTTFYVQDRTGEDRDDHDAGPGARGRATFENRWEVSPRWRVDAEANWFSDRGVNEEFFESDAKNHKDRETYARARWMEGGAAFTVTGGAHVRDFVTETIQLPEAQLWSESLPLFPRSRLPLGLGFDLSTEARAGQVRRLFDSDLDDPSYEAWRVHVQERVNAPFNLGDVRVSPFVGLNWTGYYDRTDGGDDAARGALEAGIRADLQLHRDFDVHGGPFALDGLRHVIEVDAGAWARRFGWDDGDDVPHFDRIDEEYDREEVSLEVRTRLETRRAVGGRLQNASLMDLRVRASWWPDDVGPYGREGPGEAEAWLLAEIVPQSAWITGTGLVSFQDPAIEHGSLGVLWAPRDDLFLGAGLRQVRDELFAPWANAYWRWSEKWGVSLSGIQDVEEGDVSYYQARVLRFSPDHVLVFGVTVKDDGNDVGVFFDFMPAIGGRTLTTPFDPRETIDFAP